MGQFFRILLVSPRLTLAVIMMIVGGIGGALHSRDPVEHKSKNAWSKDSGSSYSAQDRADDGWGSSTRTANPRDSRSSGKVTEQVWVNKDGVIYEQEDVKALDRSEYE